MIVLDLINVYFRRNSKFKYWIYVYRGWSIGTENSRKEFCTLFYQGLKIYSDKVSKFIIKTHEKIMI